MIDTSKFAMNRERRSAMIIAEEQAATRIDRFAARNLIPRTAVDHARYACSGRPGGRPLVDMSQGTY
jgi:hypothetical protein